MKKYPNQHKFSFLVLVKRAFVILTCTHWGGQRLIKFDNGIRLTVCNRCGRAKVTMQEKESFDIDAG